MTKAKKRAGALDLLGRLLERARKQDTRPHLLIQSEGLAQCIPTAKRALRAAGYYAIPAGSTGPVWRDAVAKAISTLEASDA